MILAWPTVNPKPAFGDFCGEALAISANPFYCCSFSSSSSTLVKCHCTQNKNTDKSTQGFSPLTSDIPWKTGSLWSTMAFYMFNLHIPLSFGGLSTVAYILHQPVLDPQTQALSFLVLDIVELLATLLLLKSTIKPKSRLTNIFRFNELSTERNWLLASALGFGILILLVFLTSIIADRLYGAKIMANVEKQRFKCLDSIGSNFLSWRLDAKLCLRGMGLEYTLEDMNIEEAVAKDEANAVFFIRQHICIDLKNEFIHIDRPSVLWKKLNDRFDHTKNITLPQAQHDWLHLRLQDFQSIAEYNSALHKIESRLTLCGVTLFEDEKLEKTYSTMHASNVLLQQQYRQRGFKTYAKLIDVLHIAEKTNDLLMKNHELRPSGSKPVPEAHANSYREAGRFRGHGHRVGRRNRRGGRHANLPQIAYRDDRNTYHQNRGTPRHDIPVRHR